MKRVMGIITIFILSLIIFLNISVKTVYADVQPDDVVNHESRLLQIKESQAKTLQEYQEKYGSESYGFTAYILHMVQIYSIPFCFLGIVISIIYRVVLGIRNLENAEKGLGMMVAVVTITIICQVLPLVFAIVVKIGKE